MSEKGILDIRSLPDPDFEQLWQKILMPDEIKNQLKAQIVLELVIRKQVPSRASVPLHGIILLVGPPGTGKTSIAKGAASAAASTLHNGGRIKFLEVEPHALSSSALGKSQREVRRFLEDVVTEHANQGPMIVLLDEVETLVADRNKMSMEANPIDVHRATDAMLAGLDNLASRFPQLVFIATSNFEGAIDPAFISRADLVLTIDKPVRDACGEIMKDTLEAIGEKWKPVKNLISNPKFEKIIDDAVGMDGRQIRKAVLSALTLDIQTVVDPGKLTIQQLAKAFKQAKPSKK